MALSGVLNVDKPAAWTSFDVVKFIRGRCGEKRVGHAGTLDPAATGVLPVLIGQATRLTEYLMDTTKRYETVIELGVETNTYDADGEVLQHLDASHITRDHIEAVLTRFTGEILQVPPAYSAIKKDGVPMYKLARGGKAVHLEDRPVTVHQLDIIDYEPPLLHLAIECGKGFYVRSLAHDLGRMLGVGGSLAALRRTRVGAFAIAGAVPLETLRGELEAGTWQKRLHAPDEVLMSWQAAILGAESTHRLCTGQAVHLAPQNVTAAMPSGGLCRAYSHAGDFLGIVRVTPGPGLEAEKIFTPVS